MKLRGNSAIRPGLRPGYSAGMLLVNLNVYIGLIYCKPFFTSGSIPFLVGLSLLVHPLAIIMILLPFFA
ncbi:hypothetical protein EDB89DRAFT_1517141 [Lactarius sanguifluus]|nr:hypothetical protein EDB89DRAFT_1517141 [Lactarius sanguifluus]